MVFQMLTFVVVPFRSKHADLTVNWIALLQANHLSMGCGCRRRLSVCAWELQ